MTLPRTNGPGAPPRWLRFDDYSFSTATGELRQAGRPVDLPSQASRLLRLMLAHAGELVPRERIQATLWPDSVVDYEQGIHNAVRHLRAALGDDARAPRYVATVPRQGYRWIAPVSLQRLDDETSWAEAPEPSEQPRVVYCFVLVTAEQLRDLLDVQSQVTLSDLEELADLTS